MTGLECGHEFCTDCWDGYLSTKIMGEGLSQSITCPATECGIVVDDVTVMRIVSDPLVRFKYQYLVSKSFVEVSNIFFQKTVSLIRISPLVPIIQFIK